MSLPPTARGWLAAIAAARPRAPALIGAATIATYADLAGAAARWRTKIDDLVPPDRTAVVGVVATRSVQCVAQLWSVWESPHTALLLDPDGPVTRDEAELAAWGVSLVLDGEESNVVDAPKAITPPDHHTWILTSGTTGVPRPVILTNDNVAASVAASQRRLGNDASDRWQLTLPLAHVGGASVLWRSAAAGGAVVLDERFDAVRTAQRLQEGAITISSFVPTMLHRLVQEIDEVSPDVRAVLVGGAAAGVGLVRRALDAGLPVVTTYGLTEACSQVATVAPGDMEAALGTVGWPLDGMVVTVEEPDERGVGRIVIDGPAVSPGYVGEPLRAGPHRTGDLGRRDDAGRLVVIGRADDVIVSGGENVVPAVVESALEAVPGVLRAAVVGVPSDEWGEAVVAYVVAATDLEPAELQARLAGRLRPAERPKEYRFVTTFPELPNGKVDRRALRRRGD